MFFSKKTIVLNILLANLPFFEIYVHLFEESMKIYNEIIQILWQKYRYKCRRKLELIYKLNLLFDILEIFLLNFRKFYSKIFRRNWQLFENYFSLFNFCHGIEFEFFTMFFPEFSLDFIFLVVC